MNEIFLLLIGLSIGSFVNVLVDRLPFGKDVFFGRSHCDHCQRMLKWHDLIPVLSYIMLSGRCRYCHLKLSVQYPIVELATSFLFIISYRFLYMSGQIISTWNLVFIFGTVTFIWSIFITDLKYRIIPDETVLILLVFSILRLILSADITMIYNHLITGLVFFLLFLFLYLVTKGKGMGMGDVKYSFFMGLLLGYPNIIPGFYLAFLTGAVISLILILIGKKSMKSKIAFGPFLVFATYICLFFGERIWLIVRNYLYL